MTAGPIFLIFLSLVLSSKTQATQLLDPPSFAALKSITVFVARKIVTMDPSYPIADAVAVADGKILSVGTLEDLKPWTSRYPTIIDRRFSNKVIYPGFIEPHAHPLLAGIVYSQPSISPHSVPNPWGKAYEGTHDISDVINKLRNYSKIISDPDKPLISCGYDEIAMHQTLTREILDKVSTTRKVIIWDSSGHNMYVNSLALEKYGLTPEKTLNIKGVGRDAQGRLNGQFLEIDAVEFLLAQIGKDILNPDQLPRAVLYSNDLAQQAGITTMGDLAFGSLSIDEESKVLTAYARSSTTSLRLVTVANATTFTHRFGDNAPQAVSDLKRLENDRLFFQGVKFYSDDGYMPETMRLEHPGYTDGHSGNSNYSSPYAFADVMRPWWNSGFHIHVHTNGDMGNQNTLNALQLLQEDKPRFDHRFTMEHFGIPSTSMVMKTKALGAVVSANITYISERSGLEYQGLGSDRASYATRIGQLMRSGVITSIHSDFPVSVPNPLNAVWTVVTRKGDQTGTKQWAPAESLPVAEAMKMITVNAAYTLGVEDKVGTIEAGKYADFVILGDDPQSVPINNIKGITIEGTVLGGRIIPASETRRPRPFEPQ